MWLSKKKKQERLDLKKKIEDFNHKAKWAKRRQFNKGRFSYCGFSDTELYNKEYAHPEYFK